MRHWLRELGHKLMYAQQTVSTIESKAASPPHAYTILDNGVPKFGVLLLAIL